ncbi:GtrA family protein [Microbacterium sp. ZXX196]|uniref:GtrA family protein n=1 Tax=Microbacterium sp. ZXX196 TaxID=2609291 RepID=UPI0012B82748|nr:hypothetical protein [Microbacterium sp. ZXX196]
MRRRSETDEATRAGAGADIVAGRLDNDAAERRDSARATSTDRGPLARLFGQLAGFGVVGGVTFVIDLGVYNVVRATVLHDSPIWSMVVSVTVATIAAWLGNRYLTFRRERSRGAFREGLLFAIVNVVGLLVAAGCLFVSPTCWDSPRSSRTTSRATAWALCSAPFTASPPVDGSSPPLTHPRRTPLGLTPFRRSGGSESRPVVRGRGQGDWSDHDEQQEASHPGAGRP